MLIYFLDFVGVVVAAAVIMAGVSNAHRSFRHLTRLMKWSNALNILMVKEIKKKKIKANEFLNTLRAEKAKKNTQTQ